MSRAARGAATVELAVSMLLIVPIFLYTLFLEDLLRHKLNVQETALSTPWDFHGLNYQTFDRTAHVDPTELDKNAAGQGQAVEVKPCVGVKAIGCWARMSWCDHTSAYNSYDADYECNDSNHHKAVSAHACWVVEQAQQVACGIDAATGTGYTDPLSMIGPLRDEVHKGGQITCSARVGVLNYFLPQQLFSEFSSVDTTRTEHLRGDVHGHYGASYGSTYVITLQKFSVVHDPWSQTTVDEVSPPGSSGVLHDRTQKIYGSMLGQAAFGMSQVFLLKGVQNELISPAALTPADTPFSDNLSDANLAFKKTAGGTVDGYYTSPWEDWENDPVRSSYQARGQYYLGRTAEPN